MRDWDYGEEDCAGEVRDYHCLGSQFGCLGYRVRERNLL